MPTVDRPPERTNGKTGPGSRPAALEAQDKGDKAVEEIRTFHRKLCEIRILDPACGSANFLYATLEHMKRLEGESGSILSPIWAPARTCSKCRAITVDRISSWASRSTQEPLPSPKWSCGSATCNGHFRTRRPLSTRRRGRLLRAFRGTSKCRDAVLAI